jgi:hypothetical protein
MENITGADSEHSKALVLGHGSERFLPKSYKKTPQPLKDFGYPFMPNNTLKIIIKLLALSDLD